MKAKQQLLLCPLGAPTGGRRGSDDDDDDLCARWKVREKGGGKVRERGQLSVQLSHDGVKARRKKKEEGSAARYQQQQQQIESI